MQAQDVHIPGPGSSELLPVSSTGDLALVYGRDSLALWTERAISCRPGALLHRPDLGAGAARDLGRVGVLSALQARCRRTIERDRRVQSVAVRAAASTDDPQRFGVEASIVTISDPTTNTPLILRF